MKKIIFFLCTTILALSPFLPAQAQEAMHINIYGPGQKKINLLVSQALALQESGPAPDEVRDVEQTLYKNMEFLPFINIMQPEDILGGTELDGVTGKDIDFKRFALSRADLLLTLGWVQEGAGSVRVELRAFETFSGKLLVGRGYVITKPYQTVEAVNRFCAELMQKLTGRNGFFRSTLAFVRKNDGHKEIWTSTPQGRSLKQITDFKQYCLSPAWNWKGTMLAGTLVGDKKHELIIWSKKDKRLRRIQLAGNTIISPAFHPDGRLFISIDRYGNPDIYSLNAEFEVEQTEVKNWAIDISPQFDRKGENMVFVSSRLGNPHIFLLDLRTRKVKRISYEGKYNTNPDISPDGRYIAYSRRTPDGHRIIVHDLKTNTERQVTHGPGNDEDPAWGPDSYFLAFSSNRTGEYRIYLATRQGDETKMIPTGPGEATAPSWNPAVGR
ncbi:MAG: hypothetical protein K9K64_12635 [Desulfohalobiaceae bacterium]|nr:hypothetical protein [Desulfohalobiaceae bacterium]